MMADEWADLMVDWMVAVMVVRRAVLLADHSVASKAVHLVEP